MAINDRDKIMRAQSQLTRQQTPTHSLSLSLSLSLSIMAQKPLMLKDFLELDANSDSCDGFHCAPRRAHAATVRCLIDTELGARVIPSRSKLALMKISAVISAVKLFSTSSVKSRQSNGRFILPRSFSKKLGRSFWKKRGEEVEAQSSRSVRVRDIVRLRSFEDADVEERCSLYFPTPIVSSCSSSTSEDGDSSGSDFLLSSCGSSEFEHETAAAVAGKDPNPKENGGIRAGEDHQETASVRSVQKEETDQEMEEEKEQLSPVSVMDFPYQDEEEDEEEDGDTSPNCFQQTLENIERTRQQLLQKIRRFESLAHLDLDPLDLDPSFASSQDDDPQESTVHVSPSDDEAEATATEKFAWDLLCQLADRVSWAPQRNSSIEKLLLGFFAEGVDSKRPRWSRVPLEEGLLAAASEWVLGGGCLEEEDLGAAQVRDMERSGGGWRCFDEEVDEVAADVEAGVMTWLVDELVLDLVSCW